MELPPTAFEEPVAEGRAPPASPAVADARNRDEVADARSARRRLVPPRACVWAPSAAPRRPDGTFEAKINGLTGTDDFPPTIDGLVECDVAAPCESALSRDGFGGAPLDDKRSPLPSAADAGVESVGARTAECGDSAWLTGPEVFIYFAEG